MSKILLLCGAKQSGKTSAANFIATYFLQRAGIINPNPHWKIREFAQDHEGNIDIKASYMDTNGNEIVSKEFASLDLRRTDDEFVRFANQNIWPYVKIYSFADALKSVLAIIFGLNLDKMNGTNDDKNELTCIKWKNVEKLFPIKIPLTNEFMTHREIMKVFGSDICRTIYNLCWFNATINVIKIEQPQLAIIDDGRFLNEVYKSKEEGAKIVHLERKIDNDTHTSEVDLDSIPSSVFDLDLDNSDMTLAEKNQHIFQALKSWGWAEGEL